MLKDIKGIGEKTLNELNSLGIYTELDLVYKFPKNYLIYEHNPTELYNDKDIYLEGYVDSKVSMFKYRNNTFAFSFYLKFENTRVKMNIFSNIYVGLKIRQGLHIGVFGKYSKKNNCFNIKKLFTDNLGFKIETVYGFKNILDSRITKIMETLFKKENQFEETLPQEIIDKYRLLNINDYLIKSHLPLTTNDVKEVIRRRKYEEFYWYSISLSYIKNKRKEIVKKNRNIDLKLKDDFINSLSFNLTIDQNKAIDDIVNDLTIPYTMNRLIQGDVGCGKTIIEIISGLLVAKSNYQVACLAPTEVLARQEYNEFKKYLNKYNLKIALLTSSIKGDEYDTTIRRLKNGEIDIIVGTHSLLYDNVVFNNLGLVMIDEQHRFGVNQRLRLINKYKDVDSLFFSATPIPRTLGLTLFNDLDISSIRTMPEGRKEITTKIISFDKMDLLFKSINNHLLMNEKAYVVVPLIEGESDNKMDIYECEKLFKENIPNYNISILHGKMKSSAKEKVINDFKDGKTNILISTTVIEVGVNVSDATMMIIINAEMFGLSTLHQLRGRVGRGSLDSFCMLVTNDIANPRLNALVNSKDGFEISEMDFKLRGPGDYLGENQSGFINLEYTSFTEDLNILKCAKADSIMELPFYLNGIYKSRKFDEIVKRGSELDKIN